ncbi:MAG: transglutaminase domain-containing protein [Acidimicrobiia bacterium]|nr:transglutaminase domain-containing protein [Acidimicrobiia bacterium]MBP8179599.1 transglutaminase domain-containing protein [Acidimicrobiia bacterium]
MNPRRLGAQLALALACVFAALSWGRVFADWTFAGPAVAGLAGPVLIGTLCTAAGWRWWVRLPLQFGLFFVLMAAAAGAGNSIGGVLPNGATFDMIRQALQDTGTIVRESVPPVEVTPTISILVTLFMWLGGMATDAISTRPHQLLAALIPDAAIVCIATLFAPENHEFRTVIASGFLFFAILHSLLLLLDMRSRQRSRNGDGIKWRRASEVAQTNKVAASPPPSRDSLQRTLIRGLPIVALAAILAPIVGAHLPGAEAPALLPVVGSTEQQEPRTVPSPLIDMQPQLQIDPPVEVFTVKSSQPGGAYWRLTSLESFDGRQWSHNASYESVDGELNFGVGADVPTEGIDQTFNITNLDRFWADSDTQRFWLPAAYAPTKFDVGDIRADSASGSVITKEATATGLSYSVHSEEPVPTEAQLKAATGAPPKSVAPYLELPELPERIGALATQITAGAVTPYDKAKAIETYLLGFTYNEAVTMNHSTSYLEQFLFEIQEGYCEQFAASYAVLGRSLGLPTRVAVGFTPGTYDAATQTFRVTTDNAHAWPEVYFEGIGWIKFEPTPRTDEGGPNGNADPPPPEDEQTAPSTTTTVPPQEAETPPPPPPPPDNVPSTTTTTSAENEVTPPPPDEPESPPPSSRNWTPFLVVLATAGLVAAYVFGIPALKKRRRDQRLNAPDMRDRVSGAWDEVSDRLLERSITRPKTLTNTEFAGALEGQYGPAFADDLTALGAQQSAASFAPSDPSSDQASMAWGAADRIANELESGLSAPKRWLYRLDPRPLLARGGH